MNTSVITSFLGAFLAIILIFINYFSKYTTDNFQRKLMLSLLLASCIAMLTDFTSQYLISSYSGEFIVRYFSYTTLSLFLIAQSCTCCLGVIFMDYFVHKNMERSKLLIVFMIIFLSLYLVSVIANLPLGFYFSVTPDNQHVHGPLYLFWIILNYSSILLIVIDVLFASRQFKHSQTYLIILFVLFVGVGGTVDIILSGSNLIWPCFAVAILYLYFFILQSDSKIDSLTGIGNRFSFNEFIDKLSRQHSKVEYSIVMIDMDKFKEINDTLGHLEGDNALRDMAAVIKGCIRHSDFAARYGGDEFILATGAEYDIKRLMNRIQAAIDLQNEKRIRPYQLYISYGYDVYTTKSGESIYTFLAKIDALMYKQKEERKSRGIPSAITAKLNEEYHET